MALLCVHVESQLSAALPLLIRHQAYWIRAPPYDLIKHLIIMTSPRAPSPNTVTNIRGCRFNIGTLRVHNSAHNWNPLLTPRSSVLSTKSSCPHRLKNAGCSGYHKTLRSSGKSRMSVPSLRLPYPKSTQLKAAFILAKRQGPASRRKVLEGSHPTVKLKQWTWQKETTGTFNISRGPC